MSLKRSLLRTQLRAAGWRGRKAAKDIPTLKRNQEALASVITVRSSMKLAPKVRAIGEIVDTSA